MSSELDQAIVFAKELLAGVEAKHGPITHKKMFGGAGLYAEGAIFAVIVDGEIMLKGDAALGGEIEEAGGQRWRYDGKAKPVMMPYWRLPPDAVDDPEVAVAWALKSIVAATKSLQPTQKQKTL